MTTTLIIARHGNTFETGETPRRIGARTNLPITAGGQAQAQRLGATLKQQGLLPDIVYSSQLRRTVETAEAALLALGIKRPIHQSDMFNEIDYGPDENRPEPDVITRLGQASLEAWEREGHMPPDWSPRPEQIRDAWERFLAHCLTAHANQTILVVTSNGIARFAPLCTRNGDEAAPPSQRKLATGAYSVLEGDGGLWFVQRWNTKP